MINNEQVLALPLEGRNVASLVVLADGAVDTVNPYQGTRATQTPADIVTFIPTAAMLNGDFSTVASAQCRAQSNLTLPAALGFVNNRIDPARLSPAAVKIARMLPTTSDPCGQISYSRPTKPRESQPIARDWRLNKSHTSNRISRSTGRTRGGCRRTLHSTTGRGGSRGSRRTASTDRSTTSTSSGCEPGSAARCTRRRRPASTIPNTTLSSATFGRITSSGDPRTMQFAVKYAF